MSFTLFKDVFKLDKDHIYTEIASQDNIVDYPVGRYPFVSTSNIKVEIDLVSSLIDDNMDEYIIVIPDSKLYDDDNYVTDELLYAMGQGTIYSIDLTDNVLYIYVSFNGLLMKISCPFDNRDLFNGLSEKNELMFLLYKKQ